jgi:hypothetical protein
MAEEQVERGGAPRGPSGAAREIKVRLSDDIARGVYANGVMITHSRDEFVLDFGMVVGSAGTIVSRVIMGPTQAKRLAVALADHLARFEKAHGNLDPAAGPAIRIGFQPSEAE